ncbi:hypothetical protein, partial [Pseudarthrobacter sp. AL20]|uniref:hypothetical protein n=1 Tax=Pseudarthrobacter sp. AL20 TaxID=3042239 RepID=UPI0032B7396B
TNRCSPAEIDPRKSQESPIPPELLEGDSDEPIIRLIISQVTHPEAFMARLGEVAEKPGGRKP